MSGLPGGAPWEVLNVNSAHIGSKRARRAGLLTLLAASAPLLLGQGASPLAIFTDSTDADAAFTTGTIDLLTSPSTVFTASAIFPGDSGSQTVTVPNNGTGQLRYAMSTSATNADGLGLAAQLELTIRTGACAGTTTLYGAAALGSAAFRGSAQGAQAGDRTLAAAASEDLCF